MGNQGAILKSLLKRGLLMILVGLSIVLSIVVWANYRAGEEVRILRQEIADAGHPLHLSELQKERISDEQNAAIELRRWKGELPIAENALMGEKGAISPLFEEAPLTEEDIRKYSAILVRHRTMIDELQSAARKPFLDFPLNLQSTEKVLTEAKENAQSIRSVSRILTADVILNIALGNRDRAMQGAVAILHWSRLTSQQPTLVNYLVMLAVQSSGTHAAARVLYAGEVGDEGCDQLQRFLEEYDVNEVWKKSLYSEIPFFVDLFHPTLPVLTRHFWFSLNAEASYLASMREYAESGVVANGKSLNPLSNPKTRSGWMLVSLTPALQACHEASLRSEGSRRCLLALLKWRRDGGKGTRIDVLQLSEDNSVDPFNGERLKMKMTEFGPIIYCVGTNKVDDGGEVNQNKDLGFAPVAILQHTSPDRP